MLRSILGFGVQIRIMEFLLIIRFLKDAKVHRFDVTSVSSNVIYLHLEFEVDFLLKQRIIMYLKVFNYLCFYYLSCVLKL